MSITRFRTCSIACTKCSLLTESTLSSTKLRRLITSLAKSLILYSHQEKELSLTSSKKISSTKRFGMKSMLEAR